MRSNFGSLILTDVISIGIYYIKNIINNKIYVGSSIYLRRRLSLHISHLNNGKHDNLHLQNAWNFYGENLFDFGILEYCSGDEILAREQYWIDELEACDPDLGYNLRKIASSNAGYRHSEESKLKVANSKRGKPRSEETKAKLRAANLGKKQSKETAEKRSHAMKGRKYSTEHRANMSAAMKGLKRSDEARANMSKAKLTQSEETRLKQSVSQKLRFERLRNAIR